MKAIVKTILTVLAMSFLVPCAAQERARPARPAPAPAPGQVEQPTPPPRPPHPSPEGPLPDRAPRPPAAPDEAAPPMPPRGGLDPVLLRLIGERRPELVERLTALRDQSPDEFHRVLVEALLAQLEGPLGDAEQRPGRRAPGIGVGRRDGPQVGGRGRAGGFGGSRGGWDEPGPPARVRELEEQHERLEVQSHDLAARLRELRAQEREPEEQQRLREELAGVVKQQFEVRSELRRAELERVQRELSRLQGALEKLERELQQREKERESIIERRLQQLVGEDASGW